MGVAPALCAAARGRRSGTRSRWCRCRATTRGCATSGRRSSSTTGPTDVGSIGCSTRGAGSTTRGPRTTRSPRGARSPRRHGLPGASRARRWIDRRRRRRHRAHHRAMPAEPEPQLVTVASRDRARLARPSRDRARDLARRRSRGRRDEWARRQPRVLRPSGRRRAHVDRRPERPSARRLPRCSTPARRGRVRRPSASVARPLVHDRRGSGRHRGGARHQAPRARAIVSPARTSTSTSRMARSSCRFSTSGATTRRSRPSAPCSPTVPSSVCPREILLGGGNIHCITQQVPSRTLEP